MLDFLRGWKKSTGSFYPAVDELPGDGTQIAQGVLDGLPLGTQTSIITIAGTASGWWQFELAVPSSAKLLDSISIQITSDWAGSATTLQVSLWDSTYSDGTRKRWRMIGTLPLAVGSLTSTVSANLSRFVHDGVFILGISIYNPNTEAGAALEKAAFTLTYTSLSVVASTSQNVSLNRSTVLRVNLPESVDEVEWEVYKQSQDTTATASTTEPYPINLRTTAEGVVGDFENILDSALNSIDIWLPPSEGFKLRIRKKSDGVRSEWSDFQNFTSTGLINSFERYQLLSGESIDPIIIT